MAALVSSNNMGGKFMGKAHEESEVSGKEFKAALGNLFCRRVTGKEAHESRTSIHGAAIASIAVRVASGEWSSEV